MRHRRLLLGLFVFLLPLSAQPIRDSVTIEVVDVPVFVMRENQPVKGLTRDDFELYVNGKRQPIEYFDVVGGEGVHPDQPAPSLRERRLFVLMFDLAFSAPYTLGRAQRAAAELIATASPTDLFAVATFSSRRGVWFATPFTGDHVALAHGISSLSGSKSGDPLSLVLTASERQSLAHWETNVSDRADAGFRGGIIDRIAGEALRDMVRSQHVRAVEYQILDFKDLSARLGTLQGQKHVVLLSEGFDSSGSNSSAGIADAARRASFSVNDATGYYANPGSGGFGWSYGSLFRHLRDMREAFQANDILLHTLDLKGVHSLMGNDALSILASETGGRFMHNRNDLGGMLVDLTHSYSAGYVLGFKPVNVKRKHNSIEVKVKDVPRGTKAHYRRGFSGTPKAFDVNEGLYLADVVMNDVPQTGTAAQLTVASKALEVRVPLSPLAAQLGGAGTAELLVYVFGANNVPVGFSRVTVQVPAGATGEKTFSVDLPADAQAAKALLRVDDSLGFSKTEI